MDKNNSERNGAADAYGNENGGNFVRSLEQTRQWYVPDFISYISVERNLASRTVLEYQDDLAVFLEFNRANFADGMRLCDIDHRTIAEFLAFLKLERSYTPNGLNRKIACLKSYFGFLVREKILPVSPMDDVHSVKDGRLLPKVLNQEDVSQVLEMAELRCRQEPGDWKHWRDRAILELFYATGMRLAELVSLNMSDPDFTAMRLRVTGKGNKQRFVFLNEASVNALKDYLRVRPQTKEKALFLNRFYNRYSRRAVEIMFDKIKEEAGVFKDASPHTLRHSFATHMLEGGADLVTIKELLGHSSMQTTQIYTNISRTHMRQVYDESHPRK